MSDTVRLTDLDRRILTELQEDGALSAAQLAERVGSSAASCWRRVKALEGAGVLGPAVRLVNGARIGRNLDVFCNLRMKSHDAVARRAFERFIGARPELAAIWSVSGDWDYLLHFRVADMAEYEEILMHRVLTHEAIGQSSTTFAMKRIKATTALPL